MTTESSRFDVIAGQILDLRKESVRLRKEFQEETKAHRAEAKLQGRAIEVLLEEVLAQRRPKP